MKVRNGLVALFASWMLLVCSGPALAFVPCAARDKVTGGLKEGSSVRLRTACRSGEVRVEAADLGVSSGAGIPIGVVIHPFADLARADLSGVDLSGADLTGANMDSANLSGVDLSSTAIDGAILANLPSCPADLPAGKECIATPGSSPTTYYVRLVPRVCSTTGAFTDNCDGTVTDGSTGLTWEKKTGSFGPTPPWPYPDCGVHSCPDPHDVNNVYSWSESGTGPDGTVATVFLRSLNTPPCFANHCDWRLPTSGEISGVDHPTKTQVATGGITDPEVAGCGEGAACIAPIFGPTAPDGYWSSSTDRDNALGAWVTFFDPRLVLGPESPPGVSQVYKTYSYYVRAVRGPLP